MAQFSYKARRRSGEVVEGNLDVADRSAALVQIERLGLFPISLDTSKAAAAAVPERRPGTKVDLASLVPPTLRQDPRPQAQTQAAGIGHVYPAIGQPVAIRHAVDGGAEQHDAPGVERHLG